ncbi:putative mitochondrial protein [Tanacetum coccineum]
MQGSEGMLKQAELSSMALYVYPVQLCQMESVSAEVEQVLTKFDEVFEVPKDLPPQKSHDHQIPLMPNTPLINVRPYKHLPNQKDAIEVKNLEQHCDHLAHVLQVMKDNTLYAKKSKCYFAIPQVKYLGHIILAQGVATDPSKIEAMQKWPIPSTLKQLRGFLGLIGYYRRFIKDYAIISQPLVALTKKDAFKWNPSAELAYHQLKEAMVKAPVLALPNFEQEFVVETDASGKGISVISVSFISSGVWDKVKDSWKNDLETQNLINSLEHHSYKGNKYSWNGEILRRKGKVVVGNDPELRKELVQHFHDEAIGRHSGAHVTMKKLGSLFYWKGLKKMVKQMVRDCDVYQRQKPDLNSRVEKVDRTLQAREESIKVLKFHLKRSQDRIRNQANKHMTNRQFEVDDSVYLKHQPHKQVSIRQGLQHKLLSKYYGPFKVAERIGEVAYRLKLPSSSQIHLVFHISHLKKCHGKDHSMGVLPQLREDGLLENKPMQYWKEGLRSTAGMVMLELILLGLVNTAKLFDMLEKEKGLVRKGERIGGGVFLVNVVVTIGEREREKKHLNFDEVLIMCFDEVLIMCSVTLGNTPLVLQLHKIDKGKEYAEFLHIPSKGNLIDQGNLEVYDKEAEVVCMYKTVLGSEEFRKGTDLYFQRHEGQVVTCEYFFAAM